MSRRSCPVTCKLGDFGGVKDLGVSLEGRKWLFYGVCIWVRLGLVVLAYYLRNKPWFPYTVAIGSLLVLWFIDFKKEKCVWWYRFMHRIMVYLILLAALWQVVKHQHWEEEEQDCRERLFPPIIAFLLLLDLLLGLGFSFVLEWR